MKRSSNPSSVLSKEQMAVSLATLMKTYPYADITVSQITSEAGLSRATFYRNFKSRDEVLSYYIYMISKDFFVYIAKKRRTRPGRQSPLFIKTLPEAFQLFSVPERKSAALPSLKGMDPLSSPSSQAEGHVPVSGFRQRSLCLPVPRESSLRKESCLTLTCLPEFPSSTQAYYFIKEKTMIIEKMIQIGGICIRCFRCIVRDFTK